MNTQTYWWLLVVVLAVIAVRVFAKSSAAEPARVAEKVKGGAVILDVRTPAEFAAGHVANAVNIPVQELAGRVGEVGPTNRAVVVYCRSGNRSAKATRILVDAGFGDVTDAGGMHNMPR